MLPAKGPARPDLPEVEHAATVACPRDRQPSRGRLPVQMRPSGAPPYRDQNPPGPEPGGDGQHLPQRRLPRHQDPGVARNEGRAGENAVSPEDGGKI